MSTLFKKLKAGLEDAIAHKHGKLDLHSQDISVPEPHATNNLENIRSLLKTAQKTNRATATFYKTGPGSYAEHDQFIGISVPALRALAKEFPHLTHNELSMLLHSPINEERLLALIILTGQYRAAGSENREMHYQFYLQHLPYVNNWNLVDSSAHLIIGAHLKDKPRDILVTLAKSQLLWERRIAIVTTWYFIKHNDLEWTFKIAALLMNDAHDLIHKAVGWMLREAGKKDQGQLERFLTTYAAKMPRTALRYALEKFEASKRMHFMKIHNS